MQGVLRVRVYRRPGFAVGELRHGADRLGAVQAVGGSRDEALERRGRPPLSYASGRPVQELA